MSATYTKLKSGDWGVRIEGSAPAVGSTVVVGKKDGTTKTETIAKVVWSGNGIALCAVVATPRTGSASASPARFSARRGGNGSNGTRCRECRGPLTSAKHHRAMGGLCGDCAFDEYDC
jgi:hypothetical protein